MAKTVRCISLAVSGLTQVAVPAEFIDPFDDGEERSLPDDVADKLLRNANFEEVKPKFAPVAPVSNAQDEAN